MQDSPGNTKSYSQISSVGVVTRDRIKGLRRCLVSYVENGKRNGRDSDFIVVDDSDSATTRQHAKQILLSLKLLHDVKVAYAGRFEKIQFARSLIKYGDLPKEVIDFALFDTERCGCTIGANRSADDDTLCRVALAPEFREGVKYDSTRDFLSYWFYSDPEETARSVIDVNRDVLAIHEQMLGGDIKDCVSSLVKAEVNGQKKNDSELSRSLLPRQGRVLLTFTGVYGDAGMYSQAPYFWMNEESTRRLVQSDNSEHSAWSSRELFRVSSQACITSNTRGCLASAFGCDNRGVLPPYVPVMRGEDALFGLTLRACFANAYFGHLPWAIHHSPIRPRSFSTEDLWNVASRARFGDVIAMCVKSFKPDPKFADGAEKLHALGKHLTNIGSLAITEFEEFIRLSLCEHKSKEIAYLADKLPEARRLSALLGENMSHYLNTLRVSLTKDEYIIPSELLAAHAPGEASRVIQRIVFKFGQLLSWWPEIVETAKRLREQGRRLAPSL
jgi:hypothetical protein